MSDASNLIVVSAPSGAGKTTVLKRVLAELPGVRFSVSHTTRPPRPSETDGVQYHFVGREVFEELIRSGMLLEWADVHGHRYGTSLNEFERARREGVDLLLDLDVKGAAAMRERFADAVTVFMFPPSYSDLERRLRGRGQDDESTVKRRLQGALEELAAYRQYDYVIVNQSLDECVECLKAVIRAARLRTERMHGAARAILKTFESE